MAEMWCFKCGVNHVLFCSTWLSSPGKAGESVKYALENGYTHIDCAHIYGNEAEIGENMSQVWKAGKVKREDIYIVSKLWYVMRIDIQFIL